MPELPEITHLASQMNAALPGKRITGLEIAQPKCLNLPEAEFRAALLGSTLLGAHNRGKWILNQLDRGWLLLNLGMGGEVLLVQPEALPAKRRLVFHFATGDCLSVNFWWFGYAHFAPPDGLSAHPQVGKLGVNPLELDAATLADLLRGQKGALKAFLLDQSKIAGIGNAYVHDILFIARLHPLRKIPTLTPAEVSTLAHGIQQGLRPSLEKGGAFYEVDLFGQKGGFEFKDILVGYREGQPCPVCGAAIVKLKTGGTSSFICPACQV